MTVTLVICTKDRPDSLAKCLRSVCSQTAPPSEILVVDDGHLDPEWVRGQAGGLAGRLKYLRKSVPGLSASRNQGAKLAQGKIVTFLDDDVVLHPDYLKEIAAIFQADMRGEVGGVGGTLLGGAVESDRWPLAKHLFFLGYRNSGAFSRTGYPMAPCGAARLREVEFLSGCNMSYRREVLASEDFDEWFSQYGLGEDAEFGRRVSRKWKLLLSPAARLVHAEDAASRPDPGKFGFMQIYNYWYIFRKHYCHCALDPLLWAWSACGLLLRSALLACAGRVPFGLVRGNVRALLAIAARTGGGSPRLEIRN